MGPRWAYKIRMRLRPIVMSIDLEFFKAQLLSMQAEILGMSDMIEGSAKTVELDQNRVGRLSRMDAMQGQAMAKASAERQQEKLKLINRALARVENGSFGRCLECDEFIAIPRLEIDPTASHCCLLYTSDAADE